ncbi:MAG: 3-deoxy-manno-octulosonate cytidylyltransferase [Verrucomicrobia bacterium]|nr:3-deoxy-manno-octulosonate cytidylyltransferase [Verrucomicrobiota bacterium]
MENDIQTAIIVPARLASTRFPRKLLHPIQGRSLIMHVAERISTQTPDIPLIFAVDDPELEKEILENGFKCIMTSTTHSSGTDRIAEANREIGAKYVVNIQGDEPLVTADQIRKLIQMVERGALMSTLATVFLNPEDFADPNQVKVVLNQNSQALYFSRSPLPFFREKSGKPSNNDLSHHLCYRHLGMYAYEAEFLQKFSLMPKGRLEELEKLEQLRVLENGYSIEVDITSDPSIGIDTSSDSERFEELL